LVAKKDKMDQLFNLVKKLVENQEELKHDIEELKQAKTELSRAPVMEQEKIQSNIQDKKRALLHSLTPKVKEEMQTVDLSGKLVDLCVEYIIADNINRPRFK